MEGYRVFQSGMEQPEPAQNRPGLYQGPPMIPEHVPEAVQEVAPPPPQPQYAPPMQQQPMPILVSQPYPVMAPAVTYSTIDGQGLNQPGDSTLCQATTDMKKYVQNIFYFWLKYNEKLYKNLKVSRILILSIYSMYLTDPSYYQSQQYSDTPSSSGLSSVNSDDSDAYNIR